MKPAVTLNQDYASLKVSGPLNIETVARLRGIGTKLAKTAREPLFDLKEVTQCDSAALALLTAWTRDAKKTGKQARFIHVPLQLMAIAKLSALDKVLCLSEEDGGNF